MGCRGDRSARQGSETSRQAGYRCLYGEEDVYPLIYGDDVDGTVDDGIPEYDTSNTPYQIVSIAPVLLIPLVLTESRDTIENQADRSFNRREKRWRRGTYPLIPALMVMVGVVRSSGG